MRYDCTGSNCRVFTNFTARYYSRPNANECVASNSHITGQIIHVDGGYVHLDRALAALHQTDGSVNRQGAVQTDGSTSS